MGAYFAEVAPEGLKEGYEVTTPFSFGGFLKKAQEKAPRYSLEEARNYIKLSQIELKALADFATLQEMDLVPLVETMLQLFDVQVD